MEYKLPDLPSGTYMYDFTRGANVYFADDMREYAEQAVAPLLAEIQRLKRFAQEEYMRGSESGYASCYEAMRNSNE